MDDRGADERGLEDRGVSVIDLAPFCDQLDKFIKYIGSVRDLNFLTYGYPNIIENRLETSVGELETILREVKNALINSERLKAQRESIKREKIGVKRILKRMRDDEVREMERVISVYDKPMFSRWENARETHKPEVLEVILTDVKGKQLALENLTILVTRKLGQIQVFQPVKFAEANNGNNASGIREKTVIPLPFTSFCTPIIPPPPPLPSIPLITPAANLPKRSHSQRLSIQRRRRLERRDENLERRCVVSGTPIVEDMSLVPLTLSDLPGNLSLAGNLYPMIFSPTSNSSHDVISENGASSDARNCSNDVALLETNNNNNGAGGLRREFQSEMRTVLQALFGELRSAPTLLVTESNSGDIAELENDSNANREIELYTMKKTQ